MQPKCRFIRHLERNFFKGWFPVWGKVWKGLIRSYESWLDEIFTGCTLWPDWRDISRHIPSFIPSSKWPKVPPCQLRPFLTIQILKTSSTRTIFFLRLCQLFADVYKNCKISCSSQYVLVGLTFHIFRLVFAGEPVSILHQQPFFAVQLILARSTLLSQQTKEAALTSKNSTSQHDSVRIFWITPNGPLCNPGIEGQCYCLKCATFPPCHHTIALCLQNWFHSSWSTKCRDRFWVWPYQSKFTF